MFCKKYRSKMCTVYKGRQIKTVIKRDGKMDLFINDRLMLSDLHMGHQDALALAEQHIDVVISVCP